MNMRVLIPWTRSQDLPEFFRDERSSPFLTLHREMNRLLEDKVEASFKNGILKVGLPKTERAQTKAKRIVINNPTKH